MWRHSADTVTTYEEVFAADGGKALTKNTSEGRRIRVDERKKTIGKQNSDDVEDEDSDDDDDEEVDDEDEQA